MIIRDNLRWFTNSYLLHPTNSILVTSILFMHTFLASNLVGCILAWNYLCANIVVLPKVLMKPLYCKCELVEMIAYNGEYIKSCSWFTNLKYVILAIYCISIPQSAHMCNMSEIAYWVLSFGILYLWYLLPFSMHSNYLIFPYW